MKEFDFSVFRNVTITGIDMNSLSTEESSVLYRRTDNQDKSSLNYIR